MAQPRNSGGYGFNRHRGNYDNRSSSGSNFDPRNRGRYEDEEEEEDDDTRSRVSSNNLRNRGNYDNSRNRDNYDNSRNRDNHFRQNEQPDRPIAPMKGQPDTGRQGPRPAPPRAEPAPTAGHKRDRDLADEGDEFEDHFKYKGLDQHGQAVYWYPRLNRYYSGSNPHMVYKKHRR